MQKATFSGRGRFGFVIIFDYMLLGRRENNLHPAALDHNHCGDLKQENIREVLKDMLRQNARPKKIKSVIKPIFNSYK